MYFDQVACTLLIRFFFTLTFLRNYDLYFWSWILICTLLLKLFVLQPGTHLLYYSDYLYFDQVLIYFTTQIIYTSTRHSFTLLLRLFVLQPGTNLLYYSDYLYFDQVLIYFTTQIICTSTRYSFHYFFYLKLRNECCWIFIFCLSTKKTLELRDYLRYLNWPSIYSRLLFFLVNVSIFRLFQFLQLNV